MEINQLPYSLAACLASLSEKLSKCDIVKKILIEQQEFNALMIYKELNQFSCHGLTFVEISKFCADQQFYCSEEEVKMLVKWWDKDCDGHVNLNDFLASLSPDSHSLDYYSLNKKEHVSYAGRYGFIRFIHRELNMLNDLQNNRNRLYKFSEYSPEYCFSLITKKPTITPTQLFEFITRQRISVLMSDLLLLFSKFDRQNSGNLTYLEFSDIIGSSESNHSQSFPLRITPKNSPRNTWRTATSTQKSPVKVHSPIQERNTENIQVLNKALVQYVEVDLKIEVLQKQLILEWDFTVIESFKLFDVNCNSFLTTWDFERGLKSFGLSPNSTEIFLLFRRFDLDCDGKLSFSEFSEMIEISNQNYQDLLDSRQEKRISAGSMQALINLFEYLLKSESQVESSRVFLSTSTDLYNSFLALDIDEDGQISYSDLRSYFKSELSDHELRLLLKRFDRNRDGIISFAEFIQELTPQSCGIIQNIN